MTIYVSSSSVTVKLDEYVEFLMRNCHYNIDEAETRRWEIDYQVKQHCTPILMKSGSSGTIKIKSVLQRQEIERFVNNRSQLIRIIKRRRGNRGNTQWNVDYIVSNQGNVYITAIKCYNTFSESLTYNGLQQLINECVDRCLRKYLNENRCINHKNRFTYKEYLFESQQSNLGRFIQELKGIFDVKLHNYRENECGRCLAYITTDTFDRNNKDFQSLMDRYQVFISAIDNFDAPEGTIQVNFESKYPKCVTNNVYKKSKVLYHLTRPSWIKQIDKEGLKPKAASEFRRSWYPERIYLLTDRCTKQDIKTYARQLGTSYIVVCDLRKMGDGYDFYKDSQSLESFSIFTDKPIPKDCIEIKTIKDFISNLI